MNFGPALTLYLALVVGVVKGDERLVLLRRLALKTLCAAYKNVSRPKRFVDVRFGVPFAITKEILVVHLVEIVPKFPM